MLAPMDDVTDTVFREVVAKTAAPDLMMTEFASSDGYAHPHGRPSVERRLRINKSEAAQGVPLIAQIWGTNPDHYYKMAKDLSARDQFVGIDINMGCPEKGIVKRGCCGGLIKEDNWERAGEIIAATKAGTGNAPVSVKTRIGLNRIITEEWCSFLLEQELDALIVHGRTVREMSRVPAHWEEIGKVVHLRDRLAPRTVLVGNGDVLTRQQGAKLAVEYGLDGIMIGRGVFQNLRVFEKEPGGPDHEQNFEILLDHMRLHEETWGATKSYEPMKNFLSCTLPVSRVPLSYVPN